MLHFWHNFTNVSTSDHILYQKKLCLSFAKVLVMRKCPDVGTSQASSSMSCRRFSGTTNF